MKIEFDIFNREFSRTFTFSLKFQKKAQVSIIYMYMKNIVFLLPSCTMQFYSSGQNILAIGDSRLGYYVDVHQISGVKWQSGTWKKLKEIPLLINFSKCFGYRGQQIGLYERFLPKKIFRKDPSSGFSAHSILSAIDQK